MYKQLTATIAIAVLMAMAVGQAQGQTTTVVTTPTETHHYFHHFNHFRNGLGLGVLGSLYNNPCAGFPGTIAIQTSNGITCVSTGNAINDIQGLNEPIIISGFGHHHFGEFRHFR